MIAVVPAVMISTFVLQMGLLIEDPARSSPASAIIAENMARHHNGSYQIVAEQKKDGTLTAGLVSYTLGYPFKPMAAWTSEVAISAAGIWLVTWPEDPAAWSVADLNGVIEIFRDQNYKGGLVAEYTPSKAYEMKLPNLAGVIPENVPVIVTEIAQ